MELCGRDPTRNGSQQCHSTEWSPTGGETGLEESMWQLGLKSSESYPDRPGVRVCVYYMRTGFCGYGSRCRYNHPRDRAAVAASVRVTGEYPERPGEPVCQVISLTSSTKLVRTMMRIYIQCLFILLCMIGGLPFGFGIEFKSLNVGEERLAETLPLQTGFRRYHLEGLESNTWYEVKISYPTSTPASFSMQLKRGVSGLDSELNRNRRLLNTEKLIFKTDSFDSHSNQDGMYVLVNVEPDGIVAIPNVHEREFIVFNIVCDELLLGIPHQAWLVVVLVLLCLILSFIIPKFLPSFLLPKNQSSQSAVTKNS